jgi:apolipoprotein N-acyltransferase
MSIILNFAKNKPSMLCFISGIFSGLIFAPVFILPFAAFLAVLSHLTHKAHNINQAFKYGYIFGIGHFFSGLYWIAFAPMVYVNDFWWAIPLALLGIPSIMALFIGATCAVAYNFKDLKLFNLYFSISWVFFEWLRSWIFTGLPWNLMGYGLSFSIAMLQISSVIGVLGLSFIVVYCSTGFAHILNNENDLFKRHLLITSSILIAMLGFGKQRLNQYSVNLTNTSIRLVQPSIPQTDKWDIDEFIDGLQKHIKLSTINSSTDPQIIIWSEAAVPTEIYNPELLKIISHYLKPTQTLITGATSEKKANGETKLYTGMYGIDSNGNIVFEYDKIHLVPFGEYIPLKEYIPIQIPIKKLTHGLVDFSKGRQLQSIVLNNLKIKPLICYEVIFSEEVRSNNQNADLIINITNDAWYLNSSGPYQHFHMAQMRAVENGLPLIRSANNGISAIIDPLGRVLKQTKFNEITYIDGYIPDKLSNSTIYSSYPQLLIALTCVCVILLVELIKLKWMRV